MQTYPLETALHLDPLLEAIGERRIVMLGEASHGTSEYYNWRKLISKRLIEEKGFQFIAVEGDWPTCFALNRFVKNQGPDRPPAEAVQAFQRWPTWMWGNWEVAALAKWLRHHNEPLQQKVGFYGLDVYSLYESLEEIIRYLEHNDGAVVHTARQAFRCFEPYLDDPREYALATARLAPESCTEELIAMLRQIREQMPPQGSDPESRFSNEQNALVAVNAERYYRAMIHGGGASWNLRDRHMLETLDRILDFYGPGGKGIVWAHNTHIGDARATDMANVGMVNIGQLAREKYGRHDCFLVGFGSHRGSVIASDSWGAPEQEMPLPPARKGSWEDYLYRLNKGNRLVFAEEIAAEKDFRITIHHRAVGVVYDPDQEALGNYVPSIIPELYDAFLFLEETEALHPLSIHPSGEGLPDTFPWGV